MKRSPILLWLLAAVCCAVGACGGAKNQNGKTAGATGAGNNDNASASVPAKADAVFAREAVEGLLNGDKSVADAFDWENLQVPGADAGSAYRELPDDENREGFRQGFIEKFSESCNASGARVADLKNWREQAKEGEQTIIAVDTVTGKTMRVFVVRRNGRQQVSELRID
jgi:hypothetical protein